jgi:hypothetical protein
MSPIAGTSARIDLATLGHSGSSQGRWPVTGGPFDLTQTPARHGVAARTLSWRPGFVRRARLALYRPAGTTTTGHFA